MDCLDDAREIAAMVRQLRRKHLPGEHNQKSHGHNFGNLPDSLQTILRDGLKTGDTVPAELMTHGNVQNLADTTYNPLFKVELAGRTFFAKGVHKDAVTGFKLTPHEVVQNEVFGTAIADAMGAGHHVIPVGTMMHNGQPYTVQPWVDGMTHTYKEGAKVLKTVSSSDASRLILLEYLATGRTDRHPGNVVSVNGHILEIDFGFSNHKQKEDAQVTPTIGSHLFQHLSPEGRKLDPATVEDVVSHFDAILSAATRHGTPQMVGIVKDRLRALRYGLRQMNDPFSRHNKEGRVMTWEEFARACNQLLQM